jgi:hypothetical protein
MEGDKVKTVENLSETHEINEKRLECNSEAISESEGRNIQRIQDEIIAGNPKICMSAHTFLLFLTMFGHLI